MDTASSDSSHECKTEEADELSDVEKPGTSTSNGSNQRDNNNGLVSENENSETNSCKIAFDKFIAACTPHLRLPDDEPILKKLKKHFDNIGQNSFQNQELYALLKKFTVKVQEKNDETYLVIQEVVLNFKSIKAKLESQSNRQAHIKKLEKLLGALDKKIKEVQAQEVDLDEDENSSYILEDKLKKRFNKVYNKICDLVGCSKVEPKPKIDYNGTRYPEINSNVSLYLKRHADEFPDFSTIISIIETTNNSAGLHLSEEAISKMAREVFEAVGTQLKKRRIEEFSLTFGCYLTDSIQSNDDNDPAALDNELRERLEANSVIGDRKINEVIEKFVAKQEAKVNETSENDDKSEDRSKSGSENGSNSGSEDDEEDEDSESDDDLELAEIESLVSDHEESKNSNATNEIECVSSPPISNGFTVVKCAPLSTSENKFISDHPRKRERCFDEHDSKSKAAKRRVAVEKFIEEEIIILSD